MWAGGRKAISADLHTSSAMSGTQQGTPLNLMVVSYMSRYPTSIGKRPVGSTLRTKSDSTFGCGIMVDF